MLINLSLCSESCASCKISDALFNDANGLRISCTRSVEKFSACEILFCNSKVISSKELESKPSSSFLNFNVSIFVFFVSLFFMILV